MELQNYDGDESFQSDGLHEIPNRRPLATSIGIRASLRVLSSGVRLINRVSYGVSNVT